MSTGIIKNDFNKETVLLYHSVDYPDYRGDHYKMNVSPEFFEKQLEFLSGIKNRNIILTFDDGYDNFFDIALPRILKYNIKCILFITTGFIDGPFTFKKYINKKALSWKRIRQLADLGIEIGSHTLNHLNLIAVNPKIARIEILDSKKRIEDETCKDVKSFAYPYGAKGTFNRYIKEIVKECGYEQAYTNIMGFNNQNSDFYELKRLRIYPIDNMFRFKLKIKGAYNWIDSIPRFSLFRPVEERDD